MKDKIAHKIAYLLPSRLVYFVVIRAFAWTSTHECSDKSPDQIGFSDIAKSWESNFLKVGDRSVSPVHKWGHKFTNS